MRFGVRIALLVVALCAASSSARAQATDGLFSSSPDTVGLWANGVEYLHITSAGNVGIGTTAPNALLDVNGVLTVGDYSTHGAGTIGAYFGPGSLSQDEAVFFDQANTNSYSNYLAFRRQSTTVWDIGMDQTDSNKFKIANGGSLNDFSAGTLLTILPGASGGYVGIGTTAPVRTLDVAGNGNNATANIEITDTSQGTNEKNFIIDNRNQIFGIGTDSDAGNDYGQILAITRGGNVGIGTTAPYTALQVRPGTNENLAVTFHNNLSSGIAITAINDANSANVPFELDASQFGFLGGDVGIANTSPSYVLDVTGEARFTGGYTTSDRRWKKDIAPIKDGLAIVDRLQGVTFDWRRKEFPKMRFAEGRQFGFIAQDVEKIVPEVVSTDNAGYKNVSYQSFIPILAEAVKQLKADNDDLRAELKAANDSQAADGKAIAELRGEVAALKNEIHAQ